MARMTTTTNSNILNTEFFAKRWLEVLREELLCLPLAVKENAPRNSGKQVAWTRMANTTAKTTPLSEGNDPPVPTDLVATVINATLQEFGAYFEPAKLFISTAVSGTMTEIVEAAAHEAAITLDTLCFTQALQDTTDINDLSADLTASALLAATQTLNGNAAKPHRATPGGAFYAGIFSANSLFEMMNDGTPTWSAVKRDDFAASWLKPFTGTPVTAALYGILPKISQNIQNDGTDELNYVIADQGFGAVSIDGDMMAPRVIITSPEERTDKPLRNSGTVGWWAAFASELLDSNQVVEILTTI